MPDATDPTDPLPDATPTPPPPGDLVAGVQSLTTAADLGSAQPAPPLVAVPLPPASPIVPNYGRATRAGYGGDALLAIAFAVLFFFLGSPLISWLTHGMAGNPYGMVWPDDSPRAGQPVPMFEVEYGTAWRDVGLCATGLALLAEGVLLAIARPGRPASARTVLGLTLLVGVAGLLANVLAAVMQIRAGFSQPIYAVIGAIVCLFSCVAAGQRRREVGA